VAFKIVTHTSARGFLSRAGAWLLKSEAENNLVLGVVEQYVDLAELEADMFFATVEADGYVVGVAFRTPPFKLGISRMPLKAIPDLVEFLSPRYPELPGVLGPREESRYFARIWCGPKALSFRPVMDQRIYELRELIEPDPWPPGNVRVASEADRETVIRWLEGFFEETGMSVRNAVDVADRHLGHGSMFMWVHDGEDVSMAGITGLTPRGARIGFVFTPAAHRRHGYGTAITAAVTRRLLDSGLDACYLFTDASNPTSNRLYQQLGYRHVADSVDYQFF